MLQGMPSPTRENALSPDAEASLRETLKRCSPATVNAACVFRQTGEVAQIPVIIVGVIERFVERELRVKIQHPGAADLRLIEDLNVDSLTLLEAVLLLEEVLQITIDNDELQSLRTLGDVQRFTEAKLGGLARTLPSPARPMPMNLSRSLEQRTLGDHPKRICDGSDLAKKMKGPALE